MAVRSPLFAGAVAAGLLVAGTALAPGADAATPVSQASGRFLSGTIGNTSFDHVAALAGEQAANTGGAAVTRQHSLSGSLLGQQLLNLPNGVQLPGGGVLSLGAINQYAQANPDGSAHGASGAITNQGAIALGGASGGQGSATLDLDPTKLALPGVPSTGIGIGHLSLAVGALAATADQAPGAGGAQRGTYQLGDVRLEIASPMLAGTVEKLCDQLAASSGSTPLQQLVKALTVISYGNDAITGSFCKGSLTVDVAKLLAAEGLDINNLPPNTHLLTRLADAFPAMLANGPGNLEGALQAVLGTDPSNSLRDLVDQLLDQLSKTAGQTLSPLQSFMRQLATQAQNLIDPIVNVQQRSGGMFVERALQIDLVGDPAAVLNLATATVGPGSGPIQAAPASPAAPHTGAAAVVATPAPTGLAYTGAATTRLTKIGLFGLLGLCLGTALVGATIGVRRSHR